MRHRLSNSGRADPRIQGIVWGWIAGAAVLIVVGLYLVQRVAS